MTKSSEPVLKRCGPETRHSSGKDLPACKSNVDNGLPESAKSVNVQHYSWSARAIERRREAHDLFELFFEQVLHGCNHKSCRTPTCATFRRRISKGPYRAYTVVSARAIATHLAVEDFPSKKLCPHIVRRSQSKLHIDQRGEEASKSFPNGFNDESADTPPRSPRRGPTQGLANGNLKHGSPSAGKVEGKQKGTAGRRPSPERDHANKMAAERLKSSDIERHREDASAGKKAQNHASRDKDVKSLSQNIFDAGSMLLFHVSRIPSFLQTKLQRSDRQETFCDGLVIESQVHWPHRRHSDTPVQIIAKKSLSQQEAIESFSKTSRQESKTSHSSATSFFEGKRNHRKASALDSLSRDAAYGAFIAEHNDFNSTAFVIPNTLVDLSCIPVSAGSVLGPLMIDLESPIDEISSQVIHSLFKQVQDDESGTSQRSLGRHQKPTPSLLQCQSLQHCSSSSLDSGLFHMRTLFDSPQAVCSAFLIPAEQDQGKTSPQAEEFSAVVSSFCLLYDAGLGVPEICASLFRASRALYGTSSPRPRASKEAVDCTKTLSTTQKINLQKVAFAALTAPILTTEYSSWHAIRKLRASGHVAVPSLLREVKLDSSQIAEVMHAMDTLDDYMAVGLAKRLARIAATQCGAVFAQTPLSRERRSQERPLEALFDIIFDRAKSGVRRSHLRHVPKEFQSASKDAGNSSTQEDELIELSLLEPMLEWFRTILLRDWDGSAEINRASATYGALEILSALHAHSASSYIMPQVFETSFVSDRLDAMTIPFDWWHFEESTSHTHILNYPFLFAPSTLVTYFRSMNYVAMSKSCQASMTASTLASRMTFHNEHSHGLGQLRLQDQVDREVGVYLLLNIRRDHILADAFDQLWRRRKPELARPLKIRLGEDMGEEGVDHGGVQQEFFRVAMAEALDPKYGAFTSDPVTNMTWFQPGSLEPAYKYELVGLLASLAIYNGLTLPFTFPTALYMKLLNITPNSLEDIEDGWPELARGLKSLRDWECADVEEVFCRSYIFSVDVFGTKKDVNMAAPHPHDEANGSDAPMVTNANREAYISSYIQHLTSTSISAQYDAFAKGFKTVIDAKALNLFTPAALRVLVEGMPHIDSHALEKAARYEGGYDADHRVVRDFWKVVHAWTSSSSDAEQGQEKLRMLLSFVTACDRLPVGGTSRLVFVIQKNGVGDARLPTSLTCFGRFLLPEYSGVDVLRVMLERAIECGAVGFGQP